MTSPNTLWPLSLGLTLGVELAVVAVWWSLGRLKLLIPFASLMMLVTGINLITHPSAWIAHAGQVNLMLVEVAVVCVEAVVLTRVLRVRWTLATTISLSMNALSFLLGMILFS